MLNLRLKDVSYDFSNENEQFKDLVELSKEFPNNTLLCSKAYQNSRGFFTSVYLLEQLNPSERYSIEIRYIDFVENIPNLNDELDLTTFVNPDVYEVLDDNIWFAVKKGCVHEVVKWDVIV